MDSKRELRFKLRNKQGRVLGYERWSHSKRAWVYSEDGKEWHTSLFPTIKSKRVARKDCFLNWYDDNHRDLYENDHVKVLYNVGTDLEDEFIGKIEWNREEFAYVVTYLNGLGHNSSIFLEEIVNTRNNELVLAEESEAVLV